MDIDDILFPGEHARRNLAVLDAAVDRIDREIARVEALKAEAERLSYRWEAGAIVATCGTRVYRLTGAKASRIYAAARSMDSRGCKPSGRRVIGRALQGRYGLEIEDARDIREPTDAELNAALRASLKGG